MCGIVGGVDLEGRHSTLLDAVPKVVSLLNHRGPDGSASFTAPSRRCTLGHTRLAIIDLATGDQPQHSPDGRLHIVFNGEIYNYLELRDELTTRGFAFATESDTEVLLHGYRCWGLDLPRRLNGMFAFAIWDEEARELILGRDRAGQKPLFIYEKDDAFVFASEMKSIVALPEVDLSAAPRAIPLYLSFGYIPSPETPYRFIRKMEPGTLVVRNTDGTHTHRYWQIEVRPEAVDEASAVARVRELTRAAVARRLVSEVPLGAFLSGGVDSTLIVGLMSDMTDGPVRTFSIGFQGEPRFDETSFAEITAKRFGTDHTTFMVEPGEIGLIDELVDAYDEPFGDSSALPTYIVSRLTRETVTVALTGDGGDEVFAGYARFRAAQVADYIPPLLGKMGRALSGLLPHNDDFRSLARRATRFLQATDLSEAARTLHWMPYFGERLEGVLLPDVLAQVDEPGLRSSLQVPIDRHGAESGLSRALAMNFETYLLDDLLVKADRCSMAHGLELRSPFLDPELVDYVARLPDRLKIRGRSYKHILKKAFPDLLSREVTRRPKWGFGVPLSSWFRTHWRPVLEERLLPEAARIYDWLDPNKVQLMVQRHLEGTTDESHRLWALLTLETWLQRAPYSAAGYRR